MDREDTARASEVFDAMLFKPIKAKSIMQTIDDIVSGVQVNQKSSA